MRFTEVPCMYTTDMSCLKGQNLKLNNPVFLDKTLKSLRFCDRSYGNKQQYFKYKLPSDLVL